MATSASFIALTPPVRYRFLMAAGSATERVFVRRVVHVEPAHQGVEVHELLGRDLPRVQGLEPVLDPDVVEGEAAEVVALPVAEHVLPVVLQGAAHAPRVRLRVVHLVGGQAAVGGEGRVRPVACVGDGRARDAAVARGAVPQRPAGGGVGGVARDDRLLRCRPLLRRELVEDVVEQVAVLSLLVRLPDVGVAARRLDAVQQARVVRRGPVLQHRPAGAALADGEADQPVAFGDVLLEHHQGLGGRERVALVAQPHDAARDHHVPGAERLVVEHGVLRLRLPVVDRAAGAEADQDLVVPGRLRRPRARRLGRVEEHGEGVDPAVERAGLEPHDVRDGCAGDCSCCCA